MMTYDFCEYQLFHDIINYHDTNPAILNFWEKIADSTYSGEAESIIGTLNSMQKKDFSIYVPIKQMQQEYLSAKKVEIKPDLMLWYEILRDIYVIRCRKKESDNLSAKTPLFSTFCRTFEHSFFNPDLWFAGSDVKRDTIDFLSSPRELLFALERYMYDCSGAGCWAALDLNINKYLFRNICSQQPGDFRAKLAALMLTAHGIVNGRIALYISESREATLKYAGISSRDPQLLKYYHYDRFTRYSYIRLRELQFDADRQSDVPKFEKQWHSLAALTEFILQDKGSRATTTTCSRIGIETICKCFSKLCSVSALGGNSQAMEMIECCLDLLDDPGLAKMTSEELLEKISFNRPVIPADFYLKQYGIRSAEDFWMTADKIFGGIVEKYNEKYYTLNCRRKSAVNIQPLSLLSRDSQDLLRCMELDQTNELQGRLYGKRLRDALAKLIISGELEISCQFWNILNKKYNREPLVFFTPRERNRPLAIPYLWLCSDVQGKNAETVLNVWAREILSNLTRDGKNGEITMDFSLVDFDAIQKASDNVWNIYFCQDFENIVKNRYIISLYRAKEILESGIKKYAGVKISESSRTDLLNHVSAELRSLTGGIEFDRRKEETQFSQKNIFCFADFQPARRRNLVILDIISRLLVATAGKEFFALIWHNVDDRIKFITHLLCATHTNLKHPFPFHIGMQGDTVLRISRGIDQRDHISRLAEHKYDNMAENFYFLMSLWKYLSMEQNPLQVLQAIIDNPDLSAFFAPGQLIHLKNYLGK